MRSLSSKFLTPAAAALLTIAATASYAHATAPKIDAEACKEMRVEQAKFIETGILADIERGPDWAKANLPQDKLRQIELYIMLDEQLKFGCRDAKITLGDPPGAADGEADEPSAQTGKPAKKPKASEAENAPAEPQKAKRKPQKPQLKIEDFTLLP
jgi:hypothetical protein